MLNDLLFSLLRTDALLKDLYTRRIFFECLKNIAAITICAFPIIKSNYFKELISSKLNSKGKVNLIAIFSMVSLLGVFLSIESINGSRIDNSIVGPIICGYLAGPLCGIITGLIGAIGRFYLGGLGVKADAVTIILSGLMGGILYKPKSTNKPIGGKLFLVALVTTFMQVVLTFVLEKPYVLAKTLNDITANTYIISNTLGVIIFFKFLKEVQVLQDLSGAIYAEKALYIANQTLPILKEAIDINYETANKLVRIIQKESKIDSISIGSSLNILVTEGKISKESVENRIFGENAYYLYEYNYLNKYQLNEDDESDEIYLYVYNIEKPITIPERKMLEGVATLMRQQLVYYRIQEQRHLLSNAEYKALKAQIDPHFLFNTLSAIKSFIRIDPSKAQNLITDISGFLRLRMKQSYEIVCFRDELNVTNFYLNIQKARFSDRFDISFNIDDDCLSAEFPSFCIQPLVENCINHGLKGIDHFMTLNISAYKQNTYFYVVVEDDGIGIDLEVIKSVKLNTHNSKSGIGLKNINKRLQLLYQNDYLFNIENKEEGGCRITIRVPFNKLNEEEVSYVS